MNAHQDMMHPAEALFPKPLTPTPITPTPYVWRDPQTIPPRKWLFGKHLIREFVSLTVAPGSLGKSSMLTVEMLAMVTGHNLMGDKPPHLLRVWSWNGEDPRDELDRRFQAACLHYRITADDLGDRYMSDSGRDVPISLASTGRDGVKVATPVVDALIKAIRDAKVDVFIVDPFVTSHSVAENDTTAINAVVAEWRRVADATGCAVELVHHVNKAAALDTDASGIYGSRGAGALIDGVRSARYLSRMTKDEAERFGLEGPEGYFRIQYGKANLAPISGATWRQMIGVPLFNGSGHWPEGDYVGVCTAWTPPDAFEGISTRDLQAVQRAIENTEKPPKDSEKANGWAGYIIGDALGLDLGKGLKKAEQNPAQRIARAKVRKLLSEWLRSGALAKEKEHSQRDGREVSVIVVGEPVTEADIRGRNA
ncbi:AAA family ATPase [Paracoccus yeei]|uniref:AAA family ATPase n=1 Tax=Paracoccus yeei TaxID=147645 RepID=UPI00174C763A|nr:AAA family ATPase [Paracoccus yeei]